MVQVSEGGRGGGRSGFRGGLEGGLSGRCPAWGVPGTPFLYAETLPAHPSLHIHKKAAFAEQND